MKLVKLVYLILIGFFLIIVNSKAAENKILFKINNEIITSLDLVEEINYLSVLNDEFKKTEKTQAFEISKNSLIREKIKEIELKKNFKNLAVDDVNLNRFLLNYFKNKGVNSLNDLNSYIAANNIDYKLLRKKFTIELLWNQLIYLKFKNNVKIDKEKIKQELMSKKVIKEFFLSEILFELNENETLEKKYSLIKKTIDETNFSKAALIYSISDTANNAGKLGWIKSTAINFKILNQINELKKNEHTKPIIVPGGFLILKVEDLKISKEENNINMEKELNLIIRQKTNEQLNQFSNIYFNKVKKNISINDL